MKIITKNRIKFKKLKMKIKNRIKIKNSLNFKQRMINIDD